MSYGQLPEVRPLVVKEQPSSIRKSRLMVPTSSGLGRPHCMSCYRTHLKHRQLVEPRNHLLESCRFLPFGKPFTSLEPSTLSLSSVLAKPSSTQPLVLLIIWLLLKLRNRRGWVRLGEWNELRSVLNRLDYLINDTSPDQS